MRHMKNHFIICGWKTDFVNLLYSIIDKNDGLSPSQIVMINNESPETIQLILSEPAFSSINYIHGDYFDENVMKKASVEDAAKLIVLADDTGRMSQSESDSKAVMTVISAKSLNKAIYGCAEIFDEKFEPYLKKSMCDEIILTKNMTHLMISQATSGGGFSHIFEEIVNPRKGKMLITVPIPEKYYGKPYKDVKDYAAGKGMLSIGLLENAGNVYRRKQKALKEAQKTPNISKLVMNLKSIKELRANDPVFDPDIEYVVKEDTLLIVITGELATTGAARKGAAGEEA